MATGVGIEASEQGSNAALDTTRDFLIAFLQMLQTKFSETTYDSRKDLRGLEIILDHLNKGGDVDKTIVPTETADKLANALKAYKVPFMSMEFKDGNGKMQTMFITRDKDRELFEKAYKMFSMEIGKGLGEMPVEEFLEANKDQTIRRMEGFDLAEMDVIRQNLVLAGASYAVVRNEKDPQLSDILFTPKDADKIEKAIKDMEYEFSGPEGYEYHKNLNNDIRARQEFVQKAIPKEDETIIIASAGDPKRFISVHGNKFTLHQLTTVQEPQRDGSVKPVIKDTLAFTMKLHRKDLMKYIDSLPEKAVITDLAKMDFITGFGQDGKALINSNGFDAKVEKIKEDLSAPSVDGYKKTKLRDVDDIGKVYSLEDLSDSQIADISAMMKEKGVMGQIAIVGNSIAFTDKDKTAMDEVLDDTIYADMSPMEKLSERFFYEDRGDFDINNLEDTFLIKSPSSNGQIRDYTLQVDKDGLAIYKGNEQIQMIPREINGAPNPEFEDTLCNLVNAMPEPVSIKQESGISPEEMEDRFNSQLQQFRDNPAIDYIMSFDQQQKQEVFATKNPENTLGLNDKQKNAVKAYYSHKVVDTYVDRTLLEKIQDMTVDTKLRQETRTKTEYDR